MEYSVNKTSLHYETTGLKKTGDDTVLLEHALDLTSKTSWTKTGYTVEKLFSPDVYDAFTKSTYNLLIECWKKAGLNIPQNFLLDQYHTLTSKKEIHLAAVEQTKLIDVKLFPVSIFLLENRISEICQQNLVAKNPFDNQAVFHFRVIRPARQDNNPLHRDVWLEDYRDCINLYIPVTGSTENSSLVIIPESHRWPESKIERTITGAEIQDVKYNVPAVTSIIGQPEYTRPNPGANEVLVFSPYLIHGGSANLNVDSTRISIEIRMWKK